MAKYVLKHLGFGVKKDPPKPPKPDYSGMKSASTESSLARSPTSERSLSTAASHIGDFEVAQLPGSPHRIVTATSSEKGGAAFGGARPKDGTGGVSPKSLDRAPIRSTSSVDESEAPAASEPDKPEGAVGGHLGGKKKGASATPPRLLDEYSDPVDLKKQIEEEMMLGTCAVPVVEDDYSVPYEVKKLFRGKNREMRLREGGPGDQDGSPGRGKGGKGPRLYDDPYDDSVASFSPVHRQFPPGPEATDMRPKEDYDEPWEWSVKQSIMLQAAQMESVAGNLPPHFLNNQNRTPQLKRTVHQEVEPLNASPEEDDDVEVYEEEPDIVETIETPIEGAEGEELLYESTYESTKQSGHDSDDDQDGYTHLRDEFGPSGPKKQQESTDNYEEPWDLSSKQKELEDKIKAASDRASRDNNVSTTETPLPHVSDTRSQEGYEKPWDWKPHQKDDRSQEGYEKPWDWKPHQKDDRPQEEYEEPWDQKAKAIPTDLLVSKEGGVSGVSNGAAAMAAIKKEDPKKAEDTRPLEEYDEPWDRKAKKPSQGGSSSDSSPKSSQSPGTCSPHLGAAGGGSPKKKQHKLNLDLGSRAWNALGERVDPNLPLDQQGWYHGSISRVDAETLLRVHKEGSYLVRMSESNKLDFSLSLKSARGFMHMKIVNRDNRYILGQFSQPFDSIPQMIHHYSVSKLPIKGAEHMSLLHPVINELL